MYSYKNNMHVFDMSYFFNINTYCQDQQELRESPYHNETVGPPPIDMLDTLRVNNVSHNPLMDGAQLG